MITVAVSFFVLLLLGFPISIVVLISAAIGILLSGDNPVVLIQQLYSGLDRYTLLAVPFFILAGNVAAKGDIARRIIDVVSIVLGRIRGGLAIATIVACAFFASISGSSMATIVAVGTIMVPNLIQRGYPRSMAIGVVTVSGVLGVLIPPSIPGVTYCVAMQTSVSQLFMAGFLPGILITIALSLYTWYVASRDKIGEIQRIGFRESLMRIKDATFAFLFPIVVLGGIYGGFTTPTEASALALVYVLVIELFIYKKLKFKDLPALLANGAMQAGSLCLIISTAMVFVWYVAIQQVPLKISEIIISITNSTSILFIVLLIFFFIAGCFMYVMTVVYIIGPILLPTFQHFNIDLIHFGIIALMMSEVGYVTPPFGLCLFVSMQLNNASMIEVVKACMPYLIIFMLMAILLTYVPEISLVLPRLIGAGR